MESAPLANLAGGSTNMADGIKEGLRAIRRSQAEAKVMILLSDGAADFPDKAEKAAKDATDAGVQMFAVGIGAASSPRRHEQVRMALVDLASRIDLATPP